MCWEGGCPDHVGRVAVLIMVGPNHVRVVTEVNSRNARTVLMAGTGNIRANYIQLGYAWGLKDVSVADEFISHGCDLWLVILATR
jgi:hypothetical protein